MDWDKLKTFYQVTKYGSFTKASLGLNISQSSLSRQIMILEERMRIKLFYRESRGISLTEEGMEWFKTIEKVYEYIEDTKIKISQRSKEPQGHIKIASTIGFVSSYLSPVLKDFLDLYPKISLSIVGSNHTADLKMKEADVLIHPKIENDPKLIQKYLMTFHEKLYASPEYLDKFGLPKTIDDLDNHRLLVIDTNDYPFGDTAYWHLRMGRPKGHPREPFLDMNISSGLFNAAQSGIGIVSLPIEHPELKTSNLVKVLPDIDGPTKDAYFIYLKHLKGMKKIELFADYLQNKYQQKES